MTLPSTPRQPRLRHHQRRIPPRREPGMLGEQKGERDDDAEQMLATLEQIPVRLADRRRAHTHLRRLGPVRAAQAPVP